MNKEKNVFLVIIVILIFNMVSKIVFNIENMTNSTSCEITENSNCNRETEKQLYDKLMGKQPGQEKTNWELIFEHANGNRNAAGPMFYHWIINNMNPTKSEFESYNKFYCGVSGSVVSPCSTPDLVKIKETGTDNHICGFYYRCCWPCVCDIMKYAETEQMDITLKDGTFQYYVLTIEDPCQNESNIPGEVSAYQCSNNQTQNGIRAPSGRLIFALLHKGIVCTQEDTNKIDTCITNSKCKDRLATEPDNLQGGMGDIFVKLSLANN